MTSEVRTVVDTAVGSAPCLLTHSVPTAVLRHGRGSRQGCWFQKQPLPNLTKFFAARNSTSTSLKRSGSNSSRPYCARPELVEVTEVVSDCRDR